MATTSGAETRPATSEQKSSFNLEIGRETLHIIADGNSTLAEAIAVVLPLEQFPIYNYILFAKLKIHDEESAVSPVLLCKLLKEEGVIRTVKKENSNPFREIPEVDREQFVFFLNTTEKKGRMTDIRCNLYQGKDLCVVAFNGESLEKSLRKDRRLVDTEWFTLRTSDGRKSIVCLDTKACNYNNVILKVCIEKNAQKRKARVSSETDNCPPIKKETTEDDIIVYPSLSVTLRDPFSKEIGENMIKQVQEEARSTLLSPRQNRNSGHALLNLVTKFGKKTPTARPARILTPLANHMKSVGCLICGTVQGTCFLVTENTVITSYHIVNMIIEARKKATDEENRRVHANIYIYFDYLFVNQIASQSPPPSVEVDESDQFGNPHLDYVLLKLKAQEEVLKDRTPLGPEVRAFVANSGIVTIIGHPDGREMFEDACRIIPRHQSNVTEVLESRAQKKARHCDEDPATCSDVNIHARKCVHMYRGRDASHSKHQVAYDTTLFEGSSGSPVFNEDGHIVAIHTQGYPILDNKRKITSIMEFGVTFAAICEDIKSRRGLDMARYLFPKCV